jgi:hypothetical protein
MPDTPSSPAVRPSVLGLIALVAAGAMIGSSLLLAAGRWQPAMRILIALIPLPFYAYLTFSTVRAGRALDEFHLRVQLEAVLGAFLSTSLLLFFVGLLQWAGAVGSINLALVWPLMALLYGICYLISLRRYR